MTALRPGRPPSASSAPHSQPLHATSGSTGNAAPWLEPLAGVMGLISIERGSGCGVLNGTAAGAGAGAGDGANRAAGLGDALARTVCCAAGGAVSADGAVIVPVRWPDLSCSMPPGHRAGATGRRVALSEHLDRK